MSRPAGSSRDRHGRPSLDWLWTLPSAWIGALALLVLLARGVSPFVQPQFMSDEPAAFAAAARADPLGSILAPWSGFLHVASRLAHVSLLPLPAAIAPAVAVLALYVVIAAVAALVASDRLATAIPDRRTRLALAIALAVLPGSRIPLASVLNVHWFTAIGLAALALAEDRPRRRMVDLAGAAVGALTGPAGAILAPLYWLRARESRHRLTLAVVVTAGALVQLGFFLGSERAPSPGADPARVLLERLALAILGEGIGVRVPPAALAPIGTAVGLGLLLLVRDVPRRALATFGLLAIALAVAGVVTPADFSAPSRSTRYFLALSVVIVLIVASAVLYRRALAIALATVMAVGVFVDFRLPVYPDARWGAAAICLESEGPCRVDTFPAMWSFTWPGRDRYVRPDRADTIIGGRCCGAPPGDQ